MGTIQADILQKQKEIESHRGDLYTLYAELGFSIALIEQITPLGFATDEFNQFVEVDTKYEDARQTYERIKGFISQLEDRSRKIQQIDADIRSLNAPRKRLHARLGAIAYEAFGSDTLPDYLQETCTPLFADHHTIVRGLQDALEDCKTQKGPLKKVQCSLLRLRLNRNRKQVLPLMVKAGSILAKLGCEADLPGLGKESLVVELAQFKKKEKALQQELNIHHSAVAKLRSQEKESPKNQLETSRIQFREMEKQRTKVSFSYGKALYDKLEQNASPFVIGSTSMALMEQITLHLHRVDRLERDILGLQNQMKVEELEAQIELENQKIRHLRTQIEQSSKQISQVELSIARKREKIAILRPRMALPDHE
ncbi:MAG: hypothetical protein EOM68_22185 [Spirochaetia bacterium]|nr:hypothetical protein [Spirochaetia bacterium]